MFGDEASFPQWGTLSYTWAEKGKTPIIETSGKRKGYKVFGLIEYWTGKFFVQHLDRHIKFTKKYFHSKKLTQLYLFVIVNFIAYPIVCL